MISQEAQALSVDDVINGTLKNKHLFNLLSMALKPNVGP
jgi:hypothetical protein